MRFGKSRQGERLWKIGKEMADLFAKLAAPAAVIAAAIQAQSFQTASNVLPLLRQREESDTRIRAGMFKAIPDCLLGDWHGVTGFCELHLCRRELSHRNTDRKFQLPVR